MPPLITIALLISCAAQLAHAHQSSESASRWQYADHQLSLRFTVSEAIATALFPDASARSLQRTVADYLADRVGPSGADNCREVWRLETIRSSAGFMQLEAKWDCPKVPAVLEIDAFFELATEHSHFSSFVHGEPFSQKLLTADRPVWRLHPPQADTGQKTDRAYHSLFVTGVAHILGGVDHLVFLLAMLLICRGTTETFWAVTGFTLGHSISLVLAVLGTLQPNAPAIEAAIGLTIVLVTVERAAGSESRVASAAFAVSISLLLLLIYSLFAGTEWHSLLLAGMAMFALCYLLLARDFGQQASFRILATALFGLVHGLGFAGAFLAIDMPANRLALSLAAFNIGVEIGQLLLVSLLALVWRAVRVTGRLRSIASETLAAGACGMGTFWFVSRLFG
ncbi:MAG: HupE/UreJ family protein [Gammaproteobacteria bacterium]|nr:HupE/UreJ family protein [Gammaproteobacteria bacterium]